MRVAVMAAGAVGGYFGARIAAAGHDVAFIAPVRIAMPSAGMVSR
jgi:ketopantoate reductase